MKKLGVLILGGAVLCLGSVGCASKGFVRDQMGQLRLDMESQDAELAGRIDEASQSADEALARAEIAFGAAEGSRELALGKAGYREAGHHRVFFARNSAELSTDAQQVLAQVAHEIADHPQYLVDLYGFTDAAGDAVYNLTLGQRRADAAMRFLVAQSSGQLSRFQALSFGEEIPESDLPAMRNTEERRQVLISLIERVEVENQESLSLN